jgi:large subunit ribosomal protein L15
MPLHRRLPKRGFKSMTRAFVAMIRLRDLERLKDETIDLDVLKRAGLAPHLALAARIVRTGEIKRRIKVQGVAVTAGARAAIEAAGGEVAA